MSSYWGIPFCKGCCYFGIFSFGTTLFPDVLDRFRVISLDFQACNVLFCPELLGDYNLEAPVLCQASWGITICKVVFCPKILGDYNVEAPVLCQAIVELSCARLCFAPSY